MKIVGVSAFLLPKRPNPLTYHWREGLPGSEEFVQPGILRIETDEGIDGIVEVQRGVMLMDVVERRLRPMLLGQDPLLREQLWDRVWQIDHIEDLPSHLFGIVDLALWDLLSKRAGVPLYQLLGGMRPSVPAYASTATFDSVEEYLDVIDQCLELGYQAVKLHAWGDVKRDSHLIGAVREHVGADIDLLYDGSAGFDVYDALRVARALEDAEYGWFEEPILDSSISAHRALREKVSVPLLVAEHADGAHQNMADYISAGAADMVRTSWRLKGGLTGALRIAHLADSYRLRAEVHGGGFANLQLSCAIPNTTYYEAMIRENPVVQDPLVGAGGMADASLEPGASQPIDLDAVRSTAVARIT